MKVRNWLILLLVIVIIAACTYTVFVGVSFDGGIHTFKPIAGVELGLDLTGGVYIVYQADDPTIEDLDTKIQGAMNIFRERLDDKGFTEATISRQGTDRIRVEIPINQTSQITDPNEVVSFISTPAHIQFLSPDGDVVMEGSEITSAKAAQSEGKYVVAFELSETGKKQFGEATQKYLGQAISITLDGNEISAPTVNSVIATGSGIIEAPNWTYDEASNLAMQIESGALPLAMTSIEQRSISSTLGDSALEKGIFAGILGFILLIIFMIFVYRLPGLMADIALVAYITITIFLLALFKIQLTLPGIAGIILGIGMAVDANVVIFARFKEEYHAGKSIRSSLNSGFHKATKAIIDSNVTTIIAAIVLALFGTGSIKGFAYTLIVSIVVSFISAIAITQGLMKLIVGIFPNGTKIFLPAKKQKKDDSEKGGELA